MGVLASDAGRYRALKPLRGQRIVGIAGEVAGQELRGVDDHGRAGLHGRQHLLVARHDDIPAEYKVGATGRNADGVDILGPLGDPHVAVDRAALLGEAGHVDDADALALEMRGHTEDAADGDDAGAADAGDDDVVGPAELRPRRLRQRHDLLVLRDALALLQLRAVHGDERRAETLHAGEVLVAGRLVDGALAAKLGFERLHRDAVGLYATVAAALAHELVDDDALFRVGERAALSAAAFF